MLVLLPSFLTDNYIVDYISPCSHDSQIAFTLLSHFYAIIHLLYLSHAAPTFYYSPCSCSYQRLHLLHRIAGSTHGHDLLASRGDHAFIQPTGPSKYTFLVFDVFLAFLCGKHKSKTLLKTPPLFPTLIFN